MLHSMYGVDCSRDRTGCFITLLAVYAVMTASPLQSCILVEFAVGHESVCPNGNLESYRHAPSLTCHSPEGGRHPHYLSGGFFGLVLRTSSSAVAVTTRGQSKTREIKGLRNIGRIYIHIYTSVCIYIMEG